MPASEILQYFDDVAEKFDLKKYIKTCRKVVGARWLEEHQKWQVVSKMTDGRRSVISSIDVTTEGEVGEDIIEECDIFINATGFFNNWRWPKIPGRDTFKGPLVHSAAWDDSIDLKGKRVAVIGNGSTGIQVVATIQPLVKELKVFIRNPTWITSNIGSSFISGSTNLFYSEEQKKAWRDDPAEYLAYRKGIEGELNKRFRGSIKGTPQQQMAIKITTDSMGKRLQSKPELHGPLTPDFPVGCRRPTPGTGYLEALCAKNCEIIWGELEMFTERGIRTASGVEHEFDVIICATGFHMGFVPRFPIIGRDGINLQDTWSQNPACYMSVIAEDMPNYCVYVGPHSPVGHGSIVPAIEQVTNYITDLIQKLQRENYQSFTLKPGKALAYQHQMLSWLDKTVWTEHCRSSFKNGTIEGKLTAYHGGSKLQYLDLLNLRRYEDFDWASRCEEPELDFAWLGIGFLEQELRETGKDMV